MSTVEAGILASNFARLALMNAAIRPDKRLEILYDILTKLGYFVKRGEVYVRTGKLPPERGDTIVAKVIDEIIVPYLLGRPVDLKPSLLHSFTYVFQGLRIRVATEILPWGGFTLVAGFLPCGFSSELSAQAGRDLVLSEDLQDVLDIESERLSVLPIMDSPLSSYLAPAAFIALEPSTDLQFIKSKYGIFDTVIICHRPIDFSVARKIGNEIIFIYINGVLGELASLINKALGLEEPPQCGEVVNKLGGQIIHNDEDMCIISSRG